MRAVPRRSDHRRRLTFAARLDPSYNRLMRAMPILAVSMLLMTVVSASGQTAQRPASRGLTELSQSLQELAERVSPSVVQVFVTGYAEPDEDDQAASEPVLERSSGSGVIVDPDGYIITNTHVIERATRIEVELSLAATGGKPGGSVLRRRGRVVGAQIVAIDHETDIAVLKIEATGLPVLSFGDSEALRPGQIVLAFGSPLGLESSVTLGVVSAVARQLTPEDPMIYIQTDAPINPGNSGGALVDTEGRLVGISTLIYSQSGGNEGIGFAAPSNIVKNVFTQVRKTGRVRRGAVRRIARRAGRQGRPSAGRSRADARRQQLHRSDVGVLQAAGADFGPIQPQTEEGAESDPAASRNTSQPVHRPAAGR